MPDPSPYDQVFEDAGREWNVDPALLKAVAGQESNYNPSAVSKAGAQGLMQITPPTQKYLGITDPTDPVQSIFGAAKYLSEGLDKEGSPEGALLYYHGGPGWRQSYGPESKAYVPAVAARYKALAGAQTSAPPAASEAPVAAPVTAQASALPPPASPPTPGQGFGPAAFGYAGAAPAAELPSPLQPPAPVVASATSQDPHPLIIGDSLASPQGLGGSGVVGAIPSAVRATIAALPPEQIRGHDVVLSSGASNAPGDMVNVEAELKALRNANSVTLLGVGPGVEAKVPGINAKLQTLASQYGAKFLPLPTGSIGPDGVHPTRSGYNALLASVLPKRTPG